MGHRLQCVTTSGRVKVLNACLAAWDAIQCHQLGGKPWGSLFYKGRREGGLRSKGLCTKNGP